ncbi:MAG TPA: hypothetical protein VGL22_10815 [Terracidiphilus sp.]
MRSVDPTPAQLADFGGSYVSEEIDPAYRFEVRDGHLTLLRMKQKPDALRPATQDVFIGQVGTLRFTRDANQHITGFVLDAGRIQGMQFRRQAAM